MRLADRLTDITSLRRGAWAIRPEALSAVTRWLAGGISNDQARVAADIVKARAGYGSPTIVGGIAVISLRGLITPAPSFFSFLFGGGYGLCGFRESLEEALDADEVSAILIDVDSPGGLTDLVPETAADIRNARGTKPIVAIANTMSASAAYWIAAQADELVVTPSGEVGSVGVYAVHDDFSGWNEQKGIKPTYVKAGKYKAEFNPDEPLSAEAQAHLQATVDAYYGMFVADVAAGRGVTEDAVRNGFGEGRMVLAKDAVAAGMADSVETFEQVAARLMGAPAQSEGGTNALMVAQLRAATTAPRVSSEMFELLASDDDEDEDDDEGELDDRDEQDDDELDEDEPGHEQDDEDDEPEPDPEDEPEDDVDPKTAPPSSMSTEQRRQLADVLLG
jgi:capsid assembly protease